MRTSRPLNRVLAWVLLLFVAAIATGCASDAELDTFAPQGPIARELHSRGVLPVFWIAAVVFVGITVAMVWLIWRHRVSSYEGDDQWPAQTHGHVPLEVGWTVGFLVTMAAVAVLMLWSLPTVDATEANTMEVAVDGHSVTWEPTVVVVGNQWWWEFRYYFSDQVDLADLRAHGDAKTLPPADIVTSGQMMIPTGEEIELIITSRDVIHSFWIPALNGKRDAVPNRFSPWKIEASDPGFYFGQCTEFCGLSHSRMRMQTVALSPADFQAWVDDTTQDATEPTDPAALAGLEVFSGICTSCHVIEGVNDDVFERADQASGAAPNLTHFANRSTFAGAIFNTYNADGSLNRVQLEAWLRNPGDLKANYTVPGEQYRGMPDLDLSEQQIDDLVAYLSGLGARPADWIIEASQVE
ncbi:MAG: cytochrome c oxidase subunit II [Acidimicrobiaceae bacterium]|nr:cytochrome c oxidase subunit II [Acidimicrobiaceae bacterium]MCY3644649.1 cytochrome c oxidase subunit II [Acidimicrobiaceae bacterium]MDE0666419.1 cytochrome c oxidase subunit II [Acidimicrobiaceae bacterium]MXY10066.1 cytochrome c oxidase subunit II [Acidimicrobiaceae bacterium]MXZ64345.1 cytochrome c oxidase subunit II [Acidimicrobiaceae bacterium]